MVDTQALETIEPPEWIPPVVKNLLKDPTEYLDTLKVQSTTKHSAPHCTTKHSLQHNTTQHNTTQHNKAKHNTPNHSTA